MFLPWSLFFIKGIYPTSDERTAFAISACDYVDKEIDIAKTNSKESDTVLSIIISFSFVNTDLRDHFRSRFPEAKWALVDVSNGIAQERIDKREGHFYKGAPKEEGSKSDEESLEEDQDAAKDDNNEWEFAPVDFDHIVLDGLLSIEENVDHIIEALAQTI